MVVGDVVVVGIIETVEIGVGAVGNVVEAGTGNVAVVAVGSVVVEVGNATVVGGEAAAAAVEAVAVAVESAVVGAAAGVVEAAAAAAAEAEIPPAGHTHPHFVLVQAVDTDSHAAAAADGSVA